MIFICSVYVVYMMGQLTIDTTIRIKRETKKLLEDLGRKGQSFDEIVRELARYYIENKLRERQGLGNEGK